MDINLIEPLVHGWLVAITVKPTDLGTQLPRLGSKIAVDNDFVTINDRQTHVSRKQFIETDEAQEKVRTSNGLSDEGVSQFAIAEKYLQ